MNIEDFIPGADYLICEISATVIIRKVIAADGQAAHDPTEPIYQESSSNEKSPNLLSDLPEFLTAADIAKHLMISRRRVYELLNIFPAEGGIASFTVGASRRVRRIDLEKWIEEQLHKRRK